MNVAFHSWNKPDKALQHAALVAMKDVLKTAVGEKVLIITNPEQEVFSISEALYDAACSLEAKPVLVCQGPKSQVDFAEEAVIASLSCNPDVVISMSKEKMGKDKQGIAKPYSINGKTYDHIFRFQLFGKKTCRSFWSPNVNRSIFSKTVPIDYTRLKKECAVVKDRLDRAHFVRVTNPNGTDIRLSIKGRISHKDDGDFSMPGTGGNLPAGEVFVSPVVGSAEGTIVFDGSINAHIGDIIIRQPIVVQVEQGFVTDISGGEEADKLKESIALGEESAKAFAAQGKFSAEQAALYAKHTKNIGELGIGLNPNADIIGNMLQDEKAYKTCHMAIGSNYDEDAPSLIHLDGLITYPTITLANEDGSESVLLENGNLVDRV